MDIMDIFKCSHCGGQCVRNEKLGRPVCQECGEENKYVFFSYGSKDSEMADKLRDILRAQKILVWMASYDIPVGEEYFNIICKAIENCSCVVLLLTNNAQNSPWVPKEIETAINIRKHIFPAQLEPDMALNKVFDFFMKNIQIQYVSGIDGNNTKLKQLLEAITECLAGELPPPPPPPLPHDPNWINNVLAKNPYDKNDKVHPVYNLGINRDQVVSVTFLGSIRTKPTYAMDVSKAKDKRVWAWARREGELYSLYYAADGGINAAFVTPNMFSDYTALKEIHFSGVFHTDDVTDMHSMFENCINLSSLNLDEFCTGSVTNMSRMFRRCNSLLELDVSKFDTSNVSTMASMFDYCSKLKTLNISGFVTDKVSNTKFMFRCCGNLTQLNDVSVFDISRIMNKEGMFRRCPQFSEL